MSDVRQFDFVIIGSGPAGQKAAIQSAKVGKQVAIIEEERTVGGACVHRGTIPSKTLRESALRLYRLRVHGVDYGFEMPQQIELSKLMRRMDVVIEAHDLYIDRQLSRNGITRIHGRASFVSPSEVEVLHVDGSRERLTADTFVVATGSRPRAPEGIPIDHEHILDSDSILSMIYLPQTLTVLGAGVIACEYASIFASLGVEVTMIDRHDRPLGWLDPEITDRFVQTLNDNGSRFLPGRDIVEVSWDGISQVAVQLDDGTEIHSDKVLVALGRVANIAALKIEQAGLETDDRGLLPVNELYQTAVPSIYAVGDVVGPPSLASSAMEQGRRAACNAMGIDAGDTWNKIPIGMYCIPEMSSVGLSEAQAVKNFGKVTVGQALFHEVARGQISDVQDGLLKMIADADGERVLGVQIIGEGATELIHVGQIALISNWTVSSFVENIFNFPTLAEAYRIAALKIAGKTRNAETDCQEVTTV